MPGPPKKPTHLKVLQGTHRKDRANPLEPTPDPVCPEPPEHLHEYARLWWLEYAPRLYGQGVLTVNDLSTFELCAVAYATAREAAEDVKAQGLTMVTGSADAPMIRKNPNAATMNEAMTQYRQFMAQFGLSPASRSKVSGKPPEDGKTAAQKAEEFLFG